MSEHEARFEQVASRVCGKPAGLSAADCYAISGQWNPLCREQGCCRIWEKTDEQLRYAAFPGTQHAFLQACPGSGKTEVVGLKAAYEMAAWDRAPGGMAVLTFTNSAADVIRRRVSQFIGASYVGHPHYVGTLASWLHGYVANPFGHLITGYQGDRSGDRSVRLVDASSSSGFLNSFTANWQGLRANEYHYAPVSGHLEITRRTGGRPEEWQKRSLRELKERFLSQGFATYEDVEWICHELLCGHPDAAAKLARRFPLVVIDECQDLSDSQLAILDRLRQAGSALHFVGDLNQAIYAFRKVDPRNVQSFSGRHGFIGLRLSRNFRSCQPIVSLCAELAGTDHVHGRPESGDLPPCLCCTYEKGGEIALARWFAGLLDARGLDRSRSAIVARGRSVVDAFTPGGPQGGARSVEGMALALHLWRTSRADCRDEALRCVGGFLSERLLSGCHCGRDRYYRPEGVRSSLSWRLSLSHILDACQRDPRIGDLGQTWSAWVKAVNGILPEIVSGYYNGAPASLQRRAMSPPGTAAQRVIETLGTVAGASVPDIRVTTIHRVKGETLDAVLLVSSSRRGAGGHWREWLDRSRDGGEHMRFAYVASSRPRHLLAWAIPPPSAPDITELERLGFAMVGSANSAVVG